MEELSRTSQGGASTRGGIKGIAAADGTCNAEAWTRTIGHLKLVKDALTESSAAVILLSDTGQIRTINPGAGRLLAKYLGGGVLKADTLPEVLQRWIAWQRTQLTDSSEAAPPRELLVSQYNGGRLLARLFQGHGQSLVLLEESPAAAERIDGFGLTPREGDLLAWVSRGKTNQEISVILGSSPRAVQKHVEHIFQKLGVETRTAATAKMLA